MRLIAIETSTVWGRSLKKSLHLSTTKFRDQLIVNNQHTYFQALIGTENVSTISWHTGLLEGLRWRFSKCPHA